MENTYQSTLEVRRKPKDEFSRALELKDKSDFKHALELVENIDSFEALKLKGEIHVNLKDFEKSVECFDRALELKEDDDLIVKKVDALYKWAKVSYFPDGDYDKALRLADQALEIVPKSVEASEIWFLKGEIHQSLDQHIDARRCFLKAENRQEEYKALESELDMFEAHRQDVLINITGVNFYRGLVPFKHGETFNLIRDADNEHDPDAIAVVKDDEIVGYVANSEYTLINDVRSASQIKADLKDGSTAEVLFIFQNEFVISRVRF